MADPLYGRRQPREDIDIGDPSRPGQGYLYEAEPRLPGPPSPPGQPPQMNPPPLYQPVSTQVTPTTPPATTTTQYDPRFEAYSDVVSKWRQGLLTQDELDAFMALRQTPGRTTDWDARLGLAPLGAGAAPPTTTTTLPPQQVPEAQAPAQRGYLEGLQTRAREVMPKMVETRVGPTGEVTYVPREGPGPALQGMWGAARAAGTPVAQAIESGANALGFPRQARTAGDVGQTAWDTAAAMMLLRQVPMLRQILSLPRALVRLPQVLRRLEQAERVGQASSRAARTITRIPPPVEGGPPPGTTIH
jgi:hypothetical protein